MATRRTNGAKTSALVLSNVMSPSRTSGRKSNVPIGPPEGINNPSAPRGLRRRAESACANCSGGASACLA